MKSRYLACVVVLSAVLLAGHGCKSESSEGGGSFLSVVQTAPEAGALEVPVESRIGFQVDGPIDTSTLDAES